MASTKTLFIQALRTAILASGEIKTFRGFNGQLDGPDFTDHPIITPAVLWEIQSIPWTERGNVRGGSVQYSLGGVLVLHVIVGSFGVDPNVDDLVFDIADNVSRAACSVSDDNFSGVTRVDETMDVSHGTTIDHQITFSFKIGDCDTFVKGSGGSSGTLETLQQHGDIQSGEPDASINFGEAPQYGTDNP